jgi:hypothetical protein
MYWFVRIFLSLHFLTRRLSICQLTGFIAGAVAGLILLLLFYAQGAVLAFAGPTLWKLVLLLTAFCWMMMILILCPLCHYAFTSVAFPTLVNCFFTCLFTTLLCNYLQAWLWAPFIGILVGIIVGTLLCYLNRILKL